MNNVQNEIKSYEIEILLKQDLIETSALIIQNLNDPQIKYYFIICIKYIRRIVNENYSIVIRVILNRVLNIMLNEYNNNRIIECYEPKSFNIDNNKVLEEKNTCIEPMNLLFYNACKELSDDWGKIFFSSTISVDSFLDILLIHCGIDDILKYTLQISFKVSDTPSWQTLKTSSCIEKLTKLSKLHIYNPQYILNDMAKSILNMKYSLLDLFTSRKSCMVLRLFILSLKFIGKRTCLQTLITIQLKLQQIEINEELLQLLSEYDNNNEIEDNISLKISNFISYDGIDMLLSHSNSSFIAEAIIATAPLPILNMIYEKCMKDKLLELALNEITTHSVQILLTYIQDKDIFIQIFDELKDKFTIILEHNRSGIIWSITEACKNIKKKQSSIFKILCKIVGAANDKDIFYRLITLGDIKNNFDNEIVTQADSIINEMTSNININYIGCRIIQTLFYFKLEKIRELLNSIRSTKKDQLINITKDAIGIRVIQTYLLEVPVSEKDKVALLYKYQGMFMQ